MFPVFFILTLGLFETGISASALIGLDLTTAATLDRVTDRQKEKEHYIHAHSVYFIRKEEQNIISDIYI